MFNFSIKTEGSKLDDRRHWSRSCTILIGIRSIGNGLELRQLRLGAVQITLCQQGTALGVGPDTIEIGHAVVRWCFAQQFIPLAKDFVDQPGSGNAFLVAVHIVIGQDLGFRRMRCIYCCFIVPLNSCGIANEVDCVTGVNFV